MILTAMLLLSGAQAAEPKVDCKEPTTQSAMNICAGRDYAAADRKLNAAWDKASAEMKRLDKDTDYEDGRPGYFQTLLTAQRAWLVYRDTHCRSEGYLARGGSMEPMLISGCKAKLTRERTVKLRELTDGPN
ncbi:lysozyme inhibitor LprI family protein [Alteriqipengyuania lutimaris]|uniref:DUF1311 domain-containing protein n=1 Tax=Alteriqipengyuania lutimaris TaxID=1538146 RepID=A0A395LUX3_9SPHN|nr:lysozyme inhibitor LprI family protein [Alteriqipengyuania lutimaris]MBB3032676.1 uncharacterized protein YecT (DUF1311 family) [Alteriqipengyuania lutimaris]RDS78210.1 DUF1311 domain-containing protein [Alteriqipengyuania lutimaris]